MVMIFNKLNLLWNLAHIAKKLGLWGILSLAILTACGAFYVSKVQALQKTNANLQQHQHKKPLQKPTVSLLMLNETANNSAEALHEFFNGFPAPDDLPILLQTIHQKAKRAHLNLNSGNYKLEKIINTSSPTQDTLIKYQINYPVKGQYSDIQTFVNATLAAIPSLAIADMEIKRETTLEELVEVNIMFVLFIKDHA
jgi:Tfp pilus assembly protein PilO